jgi:hypothetical protein
MGIFDSYIGAAPESITAMQNAQNAVLTNGTSITSMTHDEYWKRDRNTLHLSIEKVSNGYLVGAGDERFIAENVEQVTGIVSASLIAMGAK